MCIRDRVKASLVLEAIVAAEKLEATEDEINAEIDKLAQQYLSLIHI